MKTMEERSAGDHEAPDMLGHLENVICRHFTDPRENMRQKQKHRRASKWRKLRQ